MVQEAKRDCYGRWYLPAGRMEAGESIREALCREVKEEAGFECEPITMLMVEEKRHKWIRFTFLAEVTGQPGVRDNNQCIVWTGFGLGLAKGKSI